MKLERMRYFFVEFFGEIPELGKLIYMLRKQIKNLAGEIFLAKSGVHIVHLQENYAIIRTSHIARDMVEAAVQLIGDDLFIASVKRVSGTIKKLGEQFEDTFD